MTTDALVTMTIAELEQHEAVIRTGLETYLQVFLELQAIQEQHGYRLRGYATFEEYLAGFSEGGEAPHQDLPNERGDA